MTIARELVDGVALITMNDGKANAASQPMLTALSGALDWASEIAGATVLAGRPGVFSAGFDLKTLRDGSDAERAAMLEIGDSVSRKMFNYPRPLVAASAGHGLALGAIWLLCADVRIGLRGDFKFSLNETALGMTLPEYALDAIRFRIDPSQLTAAALQSKVYTPDQAVKAGFLDELVETDPIANALAQARVLAQLPSHAYAANKRALRS